MKYVIMIRSNPSFQEVWDGWGEEQRMAFGVAHLELDRALQESGEFVLGAALDGRDKAKQVSLSDGATVSTDGPFAESKEHLVGFLVVECETEDRAIEIAARIPDARYGPLEVRPLVELDRVLG